MDVQTAKNALRTAREAWLKAMEESNINWTPAACDEEYRAIRKVDRAIADLQKFLPDYDPRAKKDLWAADPE